MNQIQILVSDPLVFGRGHLARQNNLVSYFKEAGFEIELLVNNANKPLKAKADILFLDLAEKDFTPNEEELKKYRLVVAFDWTKDFVPDLNFIVFQHKGRRYPYRIKNYVGFSYLIIDHRFTSVMHKSKASSEKYQLISIGFSATSQKVLDVVELAQRRSSLPIRVCIGKKIDLNVKSDAEILVNPENYVDLVLKSEIIYTNGASTLLEALLLQKRVISIPQTTEEELFLAAIETSLDVPLRYNKVESGFSKYNLEEILDTNGGKRVFEAVIGHIS